MYVVVHRLDLESEQTDSQSANWVIYNSWLCSVYRRSVRRVGVAI